MDDPARYVDLEHAGGRVQPVARRGRPPKPKEPCKIEGCPDNARARGLCDTHYRQVLRREQGVGGIEPMDGVVYKVRVRMATGSQPYYYSKPEMAYAKAREARADGALIFFGMYKIEKEIKI